ncbi:RF4 [Retroperitoneal fibromatosis-associated herpesvirus]|uniref:RF4 n=1 Tax=Retroperitoneal fibromatosis-associated herpesvirus TaxID=111469 RepID=U5NIT9_9GAMA|nr:RF4 [Retroperitoneal fibromatosis-associated herpesvirus]AGY30694.1 RF4 [Retroperitoneal fibromatosis-associated herpesvirus]
MKIRVWLLMTALLFALYLHCGEGVGGMVGHGNRYCCTGYQRKPLPRWLLGSWYPTSHLCTKPGVIFLTKRGRQVCADPSKDWVQKLMQQVPATA